MYGEGVVTDRTCQKWFPKFCAGDFSLDDTVEVDSDQIETLIENNQRYTMREIADHLGILLKASQLLWDGALTVCISINSLLILMLSTHKHTLSSKDLSKSI